MFGTRASFIVDLTFAVSLLAPLVALWSVRIVRRRDHAAHRRIHLWLISIAVAAVLALEVQIRLAGGGGNLVADSRLAGTPTMTAVTTAHIVGAILTYGVWVWLVGISYRRYPAVLPGRFSRLHRPAGWLVIGGLLFTALSASGVYLLGFVL